MKRHSDHTGYYPKDWSSLEITKHLLKSPPSSEAVAKIEDLISYAKENPDRMKACFEEAKKYLPEEVLFQNPIHITFGYDIGVAMDDHVSLNFAHPRFLGDPEEIWFYCIHEMHHAGVMQLHPMPDLTAIQSVPELIHFIDYATFLEGTAVFAAKAEREKWKALGKDDDYAVFHDREKAEQTLRQYFTKMEFLDKKVKHPPTEEDWDIIETMSSGERLWYRAGALFTEAIVRKGKLNRLREVIRSGPEEFKRISGTMSSL